MKFNLRDLIWLTTVIALAVGWSVEHRRRTQQHAHEVMKLTGDLKATTARLAEAEDLLEFEGVVFGDGTTVHTTPERARQLREERQRSPQTWPPR